MGLLLGVVIAMYWYAKIEPRLRSSEKRHVRTKERKIVSLSHVKHPNEKNGALNIGEAANYRRELVIQDFPVTVQLKNCKATIVSPFQHKSGGDDRVFAGCASEKWPLVIVADGASGFIDPESQNIIMGGGGQAAEKVVQAVREFLEEKLKDQPDIPSIVKYLHDAFQRGIEKLSEEQANGATTLLIALLYEYQIPSGSPVTLWLYAFEGDGAIVLLNPKRQLDGRMLRTKLLAPPQRMYTTATISSRGLAVPPVVGCVQYESGDIVYLASDGMDAVENQLWNGQKIFLAHYIWDYLQNNKIENLNQDLAKFQFSDDATLSIILTSEL